MNKKRILSAFLVSMMGLSLFTGCGKKEQETTTEATEEPTYTVTLTDSPMLNETAPETDPHKGLVQNDLNGEWVTPEQAKKRPVAIMINNIDVALPQSNIEQADIIYDCLVEGGITRLMAIYSDWSNLDRIGPVRSARHYYLRKAVEYDAVYVHFGYSTYAQSDCSNYGRLDNINGLYDSGFYRDTNRVAPHNAYTSSSGIDGEIESYGYDKEHHDWYQKPYKFNEEDTDMANGQPANKVTIRHNDYSDPWFEYDKERKEYLRFEYGDVHYDDQTENQLHFKNVLVQFCDHQVLDSKGYLNVDFVGSGSGYLVTDGKYVPVNWYKASEEDSTHWTFEDGSEMVLNPGKTCVCVMESSNTSGFIVE